MRIHITQTTKLFLPEKTYKIVERGVLDLPGKSSLNTFLVVGKYKKDGSLDAFPSVDMDETDNKNKEKKRNSKWEGFRLI
jgi:hypothetical protein